MAILDHVTKGACEADRADRETAEGGGEAGEKHSSGLEISLQKASVWLCQLITQSICLHPCVVTKWLVWSRVQRGVNEEPSITQITHLPVSNNAVGLPRSTMINTGCSGCKMLANAVTLWLHSNCGVRWRKEKRKRNPAAQWHPALLSEPHKETGFRASLFPPEVRTVWNAWPSQSKAS